MKKTKILSVVGAIALLTVISLSNVGAHTAQVITTDKWPTDWRPYGGYVDEMNFVIYTEGETALAMLALLAGEIDAYDERVLQDYLAALVRDANIEVTFTPSVRYRALTLDSTHFPTNITAFRRAMAFGMDKYRANVECIGGVGMPQDSYIPLISTEWEVESQLTEHFYAANYISGNASLENAGFKDLDLDGWREYDVDGNGLWDPLIDRDDDEYTDEGGVVDMFATAGYDPAIIACQIAQQGLAEMGVRSRVTEMNFGTIFTELYAGRAWVACWTEGVPVTNVVKLLYDNYRTDAQYNKEPYNQYHFSNASIDILLDEMVAATDINVVKEKARAASLLLAFEQPQIVVYNDVNIGAYRNDEFDGQMEFAGGGWSSSDNQYFGIKVHLKGDTLEDQLGGTLDYAMSDNMESTNPYLQTTGYENQVNEYIYELLTNLEPYTWDLTPGLAYDWTIEPTTAGTDGWMKAGEKYTFSLYENETWHDGEEFNAEDVNHSIYMWRDSPYHGTEMWDIYNTTIPADNRFEITFYVNETGFFEFGDTTNFFITPEHVYRDVQNVTAFTPTTAQMIGTGPYYIDARVEGEYISMLRHQDWRWDIRDVPPPPETTPTTTSEEPSSSAPADTTSEEDDDAPGFEVLTAFAVLMATAVYIRRRRK